eukprot:5529238-Pyramimonas_sp.AAC.1
MLCLSSSIRRPLLPLGRRRLPRSSRLFCVQTGGNPNMTLGLAKIQLGADPPAEKGVGKTHP